MHSGWKSQKKSHSINVDKSLLKRPKMVTFGKLWKVEACGQTILQDRSLLIDQKLIENTKIQKFKFDILSNWVNCLMSCSRTFKNHLIFSFKNGTALHDFLPYVFFAKSQTQSEENCGGKNMMRMMQKLSNYRQSKKRRKNSRFCNVHTFHVYITCLVTLFDWKLQFF